MKKKVKAIFVSVGAMALSAAAVLTVMSLIIAKMGVLPKNTVTVLTTAAGCLAVFLGGFFASVCAKENGIIFGILSGVVLVLVIALISLFTFQNELDFSSIGKIAAIILSGSIGGILGVNRKSKVKF